MIAPLTFAETHSEIKTVTKMTRRIVETCVHARVLMDPFNGILDLNENNGSFTYVPNDGFTGSDAFIYKY